MTLDEMREKEQEQKVLANIKAILLTPAGKEFVKYLFDSLSVGELPAQGLTGEILHDTLGYLRAGKSIFNMVTKASPEQAALLLAEVIRENYVIQEMENRNSNGANS